jgi:hypothetical protein
MSEFVYNITLTAAIIIIFVHYILEYSSNLASRNFKVVVMKNPIEMISKTEGHLINICPFLEFCELRLFIWEIFIQSKIWPTSLQYLQVIGY